jgi:uncharacterized membrane protein YeaQ/YmgE (transglycosylase-associated protein family)
VIVPFITGVFYIFKENSGGAFFEAFLGSVIVLGIYFIVFRYCIFRTELIIDKLQLDKGFIEEKFETKIHRSTVLRIAIIVIGSVIIIDALPIFCKQVFSYSQMGGPNSGFKDNPASGWIVFYIVKLLIGFFLMTSSRLVVNFIERKRKDTVAVQQSTEE